MDRSTAPPTGNNHPNLQLQNPDGWYCVDNANGTGTPAGPAIGYNITIEAGAHLSLDGIEIPVGAPGQPGGPAFTRIGGTQVTTVSMAPPLPPK